MKIKVNAAKKPADLVTKRTVLMNRLSGRETTAGSDVGIASLISVSPHILID
jgi:hypothetical protein